RENDWSRCGPRDRSGRWGQGEVRWRAAVRPADHDRDVAQSHRRGGSDHHYQRAVAVDRQPGRLAGSYHDTQSRSYPVPGTCGVQSCRGGSAMTQRRQVRLLVAIVLIAGLLPATVGTVIEARSMSARSIEGQDGWSGGTIPVSASIDQVVDQSGVNQRTGTGAWRISNNTSLGNHNRAFAV